MGFKTILLIIGIFVGVLPAQKAGARQVAAKSDRVEVYAEANKSSKVLKTLKSGESLEAKDRKGMFWQVQLDDGKSAFVSVMQVKPTGSEGESNISSALREAVQKERNDDDAANVRSRSAVMGVRGLDESGETAFAGNAKPNLRMVYSMENFMVRKEDVNRIGSLVEEEVAGRAKQKGRQK